MLKFRTFRNALLRDTHTVDGRFDVLENLFRIESAAAVLRPISEGLALFAELDTRPGSRDTPFFSQPLAWVAVFSERLPDAEPDLLGTLLSARLRESVLRRKGNLLVQPLSLQEGGYLSGYMFLKNLWLKLLPRCGRFADLDFFLQYMRSYFYEDLGMVAAIFNPETVEMTTVNSIIRHVANRIEQLLAEADLDARVTEFEQDVLENPGIPLSGTKTAPPQRRGILVGEHEASLGARFYKENEAELDPESAQDDLSGRLAGLHQVFIARRQLLCVARETVEVKVSTSRGNILCYQDDSLLCVIPATDDVNELPEKGTIAYMVNPGSFGWAVSVSCNGRVVGLSSHPDMPEEELNLARQYPADDSSYLMQLEWIDELLASVLDQGGMKSYWAHFVKERDNSVNSLFKIGASLTAPETHFTQCGSVLETQGLWEMLDGDLDNINSYALLGLCTSLRIIKNTDLQSLFSEFNCDLNRLISRIGDSRNTYHLALVNIHQETMVSYY